MRNIGILSTSHYLPQTIHTNEDLAKDIKGLTPEWVEEKTGIKRRFHMSKDETASLMAINSVISILRKSSIDPKSIGLIIVASFSQDYLFPPMSAKIHAAINGSKDCQIMDINTNCSGLVTATTLAAERMTFDEGIKFALVIGVEAQSPYLNMKDRDTAMFFSDGASCILLGLVDKTSGYINSKFTTDSSAYESVRMRGGGSKYPISHLDVPNDTFYIEQNGLATWKQAITNLPYVLKELMTNSNKKLDDIDFFIFHQANAFLIEYIMKKLKIPEEKTFINVREIGNTGSASIGIALDEAYSKGLIEKNSYLVLVGIGAGFNFGANLWRI